MRISNSTMAIGFFITGGAAAIIVGACKESFEAIISGSAAACIGIGGAIYKGTRLPEDLEERIKRKLKGVPVSETDQYFRHQDLIDYRAKHPGERVETVAEIRRTGIRILTYAEVEAEIRMKESLKSQQTEPPKIRHTDIDRNDYMPNEVL